MACLSTPPGQGRFTTVFTDTEPAHSYDDIQYAAFAGVPLSSIRYATREGADLAVERLMELIAAEDILPPPRVSMIDPDLTIRDSTRLLA